MTSPEVLRQIPQVDATLRAVPDVVEAWGHPVARRLVQEEIDAAREAVRRGEARDAATIEAAVRTRATTLTSRRLRRVINATGVILHTNLGRAPLSDEAVEAVAAAARSTALELDIETGERGARAPVASFALAALTGAEAALVVNNNAGAVLLALAALAKDREVIVSRGELIEIGGEFRLPDVMEASGAVLREVGTTNRTHARDYRRAVGPRSALMLVVHPSNYEITGFTASPNLDEIVAIAHEAGLPVLFDTGSGLLAPDERMPREPDASSALATGVDLVCFSGDKLLGGPQAGVLAGRSSLIEACRRNPIARAVRADKLTLAAMEATAIAHSRGEAVPVGRMLDANAEDIGIRAKAVADQVEGAMLIEGSSVTGGGSMPGGAIPTVLVAIEVAKPDSFAERLRGHDPPVIARVTDGSVLIDLRTVDAFDDTRIASALRAALAG
jgi:L-seryl-tRNA(Ser) seleniumtransferase